MRPLQRLDVGARAAQAIELALEVEALVAGPHALHHLDVLGGAAIAHFLGGEVALVLLLGIAGARDDVDRDAPAGELIEGGDLARRQGRRDESRTMGDEKTQPFGVLRRVLGDQKPLGRRRGVADQRQVEPGLVVHLGEGTQVGGRKPAADDMDGGAVAGRRDADHSDHPHRHGFLRHCGLQIARC